ncbi:APC family permease [Bacillus sp. N3536]|nr:APC family permease [Bacillus sp. N3536]
MKITNPANWVMVIGIILVISAFLRLFGFPVPSLVVALISVVAALISLTDVLEVTEYKKHSTTVQKLTFGVFGLAFILWLFQFNSKISLIQNIGDGFTLMGLGLVILLYGWKERIELKKEQNTEKAIEINDEYKFKITKNEYDEVMKLNDIIERLKKIDQETLAKNRLHDGWAQFSDTLVEHLQKWGGEPFYDGLNRQKFTEFIISLDSAAEQISNIANTDYQTQTTKEIDIGLNIVEVSIQPRMNNMHIQSIDDVYKELKKSLNVWDEFKDLVNKRYEKERAELRK